MTVELKEVVNEYIAEMDKLRELNRRMLQEGTGAVVAMGDAMASVCGGHDIQHIGLSLDSWQNLCAAMRSLAAVLSKASKP